MKNSILMVEDSETSGPNIKRCLERREYIVSLYANAWDAMEAIKDNLQYDILLVDMALNSENNQFHQYDGHDVIDISKKINPKTPIISLSGYDKRPKDTNKHLVKPVHIRRIITSIESCIEN